MLKLLVPRVRLFSTVVQAINHVQEASLNEKCILVNEKDKAVGQASKRDCHMVGSLLLHRAFSVFLFNSKNELLLQKRSSTKVTFPDHITNTCCSHPLFDINDERIEPGALGVKLAAIRRLEFELGISQNLVAPEDLHYITRILYKSIGDGNWGEHEIDYILLIKKDLPVKPNPDEVSKVFYVPRDDFSDYMDKLKDPVTPWFKLVSNNGLKTWWDNIHRIDQYKDHVTIHRFDQH